MKILFDCIVTQTPSKCSTTIQFVILAEKLLKHPDVFIYWPVPEWAFVMTEEFNAFYPDDPRIMYIPIPQSKDRMREYNRIHPVLEDLLSFNGKGWDWDVVVTVRSTQVPLMRILSTSPRQKHRIWTKKILLIEDMMILSEKKYISQSNEDVQDRMTIEAYLAADKTFIPAYHEKNMALKVCRQHFSAARWRDIQAKVQEVCHVELSAYKYGLKTKYKYDGSRKMCVAFVGRLEKTISQLFKVDSLLTNQFIMHSKDVRVIVCTVSSGTRVFDPKVVEILHPKREEFWRIAQEEMDVAVNMVQEVELSLSMLEPIMFGVPLIVIKRPWSIGMLGENYPFFVSGEMEMYATINYFKNSYNKMYLEFERWYKEWFIPEYTRREKEEGMYNLIEKETVAPLDNMQERLKGLEHNEIVSLMMKHGGNEFVILDLLTKLGDTHLKSLYRKLQEDDREDRGLVWSTPWNEFRLALLAFHGYKAATVKWK